MEKIRRYKCGNLDGGDNGEVEDRANEGELEVRCVVARVEVDWGVFDRAFGIWVHIYACGSR